MDQWIEAIVLHKSVSISAFLKLHVSSLPSETIAVNENTTMKTCCGIVTALEYKLRNF